MAHFKNQNSIPSVPVVWRSPGKHFPVEWHTVREPFTTWVAKVWNYCDGNGIEKPTADALEVLACTQLPAWACDEQRGQTVHAVPAAGSQRATGCSACGGRARYV